MYVFQKNPLYLRETHIISSDNVSFLDKPTLSADNRSLFRKNLVYQTEKPTLSEINLLYLIIVTTACHTKTARVLVALLKIRVGKYKTRPPSWGKHLSGGRSHKAIIIVVIVVVKAHGSC